MYYVLCIIFLTVTNTSDNGTGEGIAMSNANVELMDVALKGCSSSALFIPVFTSENTFVATRCEFANGGRVGALVCGSLTSATFNNCVFHDNELDGIYGNRSTIHLHGEVTAIHSNGRDGIYAEETRCRIIIHLPSHHNTSYNNGEDRKTTQGGTITNVED